MASKKFVGSEGEYLQIEDAGQWNGYWIVWFYPDSEFGNGDAALGESRLSHDKVPQKRSDYEFWIAERAAKPFAEAGWTPKEAPRFIFATKKKANEALKAANEALLNNRGDQPWPEWALKAKEAGWKPPKGWKP